MRASRRLGWSASPSSGARWRCMWPRACGPANALNSGRTARFIVSCRPSLHFYAIKKYLLRFSMANYVYTMNKVGKIVPPKRQILKDISLSFFPGAKIGVLGLNGSGKSTLLKIMAGIDTDIQGEAVPMPGLNIGYLPQEPQLDPEKTVRQEVESGLGEVFEAQAKLEAVYAAYAEEDADFDALATEQARLEAIISTSDGGNLNLQLEMAADAAPAAVGSQDRRA